MVLMKSTRFLSLVCGSLTCLLLATAAGAIVVDPNTDADVLASHLLGSSTGLVIRSSSLQYCSTEAAVSSGTYTNASGTYGIGPGVVLSTGNVSGCGDGPDADLSHNYGIPADEPTNTLLSPITGATNHFDCTILNIVFDLLPGYDGISIDTVFASEEYPRYQNTYFNDGLGIYLNNENIAVVSSGYVNISNEDVGYLSGTAFNGVLSPDGVPLLSFSRLLGNGALSNRLVIVIGDASDSALDTAAFVGNLRARPVPEPSGILVVGLGFIALSRCAISTRAGRRPSRRDRTRRRQ
jgi:hypothetical protein